jgi:Co/Zn/Cd efflux system component
MHELTLEPWVHAHRFLGARHDEHARRTRWVVALTFGMMVVEVAGGAPALTRPRHGAMVPGVT